MLTKVSDSPVILAQRIFSLFTPFTDEQLKSAYRRECKKHHPDVGGNADAFKKVSEAYSLCSKLASSNAKDLSLYADSGELLSDLGKGLGPLRNGVECTSCRGKGYQINHHQQFSPTYPRRDIRFQPMFRVRLETKRSAIVCYKCSGSGETEIYNPVIPKGLLASIKVKK